MKYHPLVKLHQLYDGFCQPFKVGRHNLLLICEQGKNYLIANRCPHMEAPLHNSTVHDGLIRCASHGIEFSLVSGEACGQMKNCVDGLQRYEICYEADTLGVVL